MVFEHVVAEAAVSCDGLHEKKVMVPVGVPKAPATCPESLHELPMVCDVGSTGVVVVVLGQVLKLPGPTKSLRSLELSCDVCDSAITVLEHPSWLPMPGRAAKAVRSIPPSTNSSV